MKTHPLDVITSPHTAAAYALRLLGELHLGPDGFPAELDDTAMEEGLKAARARFVARAPSFAAMWEEAVPVFRSWPRAKLPRRRCPVMDALREVCPPCEEGRHDDCCRRSCECAHGREAGEVAEELARVREELAHVRDDLVLVHANYLATWNAWFYPGTRVAVRITPHGPEYAAITRSEARMVDGTPMVAIKGRAGGWQLAYCRAFAPGETLEPLPPLEGGST